MLFLFSRNYCLLLLIKYCKLFIIINLRNTYKSQLLKTHLGCIHLSSIHWTREYGQYLWLQLYYNKCKLWRLWLLYEVIIFEMKYQLSWSYFLHFYIPSHWIWHCWICKVKIIRVVCVYILIYGLSVKRTAQKFRNLI